MRSETRGKGTLKALFFSRHQGDNDLMTLLGGGDLDLVYHRAYCGSCILGEDHRIRPSLVPISFNLTSCSLRVSRFKKEI